MPLLCIEPHDDLGGAARMQKDGVVLAGVLDAPKSRLLLILALAQYGDNASNIQTLFNHYQA